MSSKHFRGIPKGCRIFLVTLGRPGFDFGILCKIQKQSFKGVLKKLF